MPTKKEIANMTPAAKTEYEVGRQGRAARKQLRTTWRTGASEQEKAKAMRLAEPESVAQTLGPQRALELGITTGEIAKELKIGEYSNSGKNSEPGGGLQKLVLDWRELRRGGINITKEDFEKMLKDVEAPEEEFAALKDTGKTTTGPRASVNKLTRTHPKLKPFVSIDESGQTTGQGRKRALDDRDEESSNTPKKQKKSEKSASQYSRKAQAKHPLSPPNSCSPEAQDSSLANTIDTASREDEASCALPSPSAS
ncbi:hypothetical protein F5Y19DRAFT_480447 [Xylariaceae sp. FL1651]|nr:hypothetical protein F5Y19DRAFT_480447 [Xylariaceae sp. FL1651]